jgi:hypothetical protein
MSLEQVELELEDQEVLMDSKVLRAMDWYAECLSNGGTSEVIVLTARILLLDAIQNYAYENQ